MLTTWPSRPISTAGQYDRSVRQVGPSPVIQKRLQGNIAAAGNLLRLDRRKEIEGFQPQRDLSQESN